MHSSLNEMFYKPVVYSFLKFYFSYCRKVILWIEGLLLFTLRSTKIKMKQDMVKKSLTPIYLISK